MGQHPRPRGKREQQRLFEDVVPDAFSAEPEHYKECSLATAMSLGWMPNCLRPLGVPKYQLEANYGQGKLGLQPGFLQVNLAIM